MTSQTIYHYVYRITNIIEKKHYYGKRSSKCDPKLDLGVKYFSSSTDKEFRLDQKLNPQNYRYKIVGIFESCDLAILREIKLHAKFDVKTNKKFYNRANSICAGFSVYGTKASKETRLKLSKIGKGKKHSEERKQKRELAIVAGEIKTTKGQSVSEETKSKISRSSKGKPKSEAFKEKLRGKPRRLEIREKISKSKLGKSNSEEHKKACSIAFRKFYYVTPIGTVDDTRHLEPIITTMQIRYWCSNPDKIISNLSYTKSKYLYTNFLREEIVGKTYRELGFNRIKKD